MKKRMTAIFLAVIMILSIIPFSAAAAQGTLAPSTARLFVNGTEVATSHRDNEPFLIDGTTFLPLTALNIALGIDAVWNPVSSRVYLNNAPEVLTVAITLGQDTSTDGIILFAAGEVEDFVAVAGGEELSGVPLQRLFDLSGFDYAQARNIIVVGCDGFTVSISLEDALNSAYVVYEDRGTFRLIMAADEARGRWVRGYALEIILDVNETATVFDREISIFANDEALSPTNAAGATVAPFMFGGMIYLPLRAVADALDFDLEWDSFENIIFLGERPEVTAPEENPAFAIIAEGRNYTVTMSDFIALAPQDVNAVARGEERNFTGVAITAILDYLGINYAAIESVNFTAANDTTLVVPAYDVLSDYAFLVIAEDGVDLGAWAAGGSGPFRLVLAQDQFPQRWISNVVELALVGDAPSIDAYEIPETATFSVIAGPQRVGITMDTVEYIGPVEFTWQGREYTGIPLAALFAYLDMDFAHADSIAVRATDGFNAVLTVDEVKNYAFIVFAEDGEPVTDDEKFALVMSQDERRTRFVRQLASITVYEETARDFRDDVETLDDYEFFLVIGNRAYIVNKDVINLIGPEDFASGDRNFTGVSLASLIEYFLYDIEGHLYNVTTVRISTADGMEHTWTAEEAFANGYIAFLEDREPLRERDYPFRSILVGSPANRWMGQVQVITLI